MASGAGQAYDAPLLTLESRLTRLGKIFALTLACAAVGGGMVHAATQPTVIGKPRPAPPGPSQMKPLPPAVIDNSLAIGGEEIDARKSNSRMAVDVHVNGSGPYRFIVDSGADTSVVGVRIAEKLQLPLGEPVILNGMTARNIVDRVEVAELTLGPSTIRDLQLPALREEHLGGDGLIGIDALVEQRLLMDFNERSIKVENASTPVKVLPGEIVITARRHRGQLILTEVEASGLKLNAVIDTGTEVTIGNSALREKIVRKRGKLTTVATTGVTGVTVDLEMAIISELKLGPVTLRNVPIAFADLPPFEVFGLADQPALLLGTDMLELFRRVSLDFRTRKVRFQLKRCGSMPVTLHTSLSASSSRIIANSDEACRG